MNDEAWRSARWIWQERLSRYGGVALLTAAMVVCIAVASRYEREFIGSLETGFEHRVELGDLASSVKQLRRLLDAPRALDPAYLSGLVESVKEVESKAKAQVDVGRVSELVIPAKELNAIIGMQKGFERLAASTAQVERAYNLRAALKPTEPSDAPALKRLGGLIEEYFEAANALRNAHSSANAITALRDASMAIGENLPAASTESRRKNAPAAWREVLAALPSERGDLVDRLMADARMLEDLQAQRLRAIARLEQVSAKVESAERLLLQARAGGGLLLVSVLLTWTGVALGLLAVMLAFRQGSRYGHGAGREDSRAEHRVPPTSSAVSSVTDAELVDDANESRIASLVAKEAGLSVPGPLQTASASPPERGTSGSSVGTSASSGGALSAIRLAAESAVHSAADGVTSGYWIEAGSMAERRVAMLDRQSQRIEQNVSSVLGAAETLASRVDLVVQSLSLVNEVDPAPASGRSDLRVLRKRVEDLQSLALNLSLKVTSGDNDPVLDELERFNEELDALAAELKQLGSSERMVGALERRVALSLDEGRRMTAAADTLRERSQTLFEDAARFRRHVEALVRSIQEGAVSELPADYVRSRGSIV
jgi:hypothetical protein